MNKSVLLNGFIISFLFLIAKFIEMRFITKENVPPKILVRDALLVYASVILAHYILSQLNNKQTKEFVEVFTDNPSF
tara:strand:+ start:125 stop:355 length:231 start_codon:yes stop_codon:yes gene_type:complete